jgi:hypothetical protein
MTMPVKLSMIYLKHQTKQTMDAGAAHTENIDGLQRDSNNPCAHGIACAFFRLALTTVYKHCYPYNLKS